MVTQRAETFLCWILITTCEGVLRVIAVLGSHAVPLEKDYVGTARVGTGAFARPAKAKPSASVATDAPVRPGREATAPPSAPTMTPKLHRTPPQSRPTMSRHRPHP